MDWAFLFCQGCGKSVRHIVYYSAVAVCKDCEAATAELPQDLPNGAVGFNDRFIWLDGYWIGRHCKRCNALCPGGTVGLTGLCNECNKKAQPGCFTCGKEPATPLLGRGVNMCEFHTFLELVAWERTKPIPVDPRGLNYANISRHRNNPQY